MVRRSKGYDAQFALRLPSDLKTECELLAISESISLNDWIVLAMQDRYNLATGKNITSEIVELPPVYREIVRKEIREHDEEYSHIIKNLRGECRYYKEEIEILRKERNDISRKHHEECLHYKEEVDKLRKERYDIEKQREEIQKQHDELDARISGIEELLTSMKATSKKTKKDP